ncbi:hypothetical protein [Brevundimonas sp. LM2]|uniref:hypothetical protein n=1 Tax=Brevundimonas sp. LM2 TaxID=1938605 RepID=UPI0012372683|nr:hypothetical protein [Brevundimonas sp. LM2]
MDHEPRQANHPHGWMMRCVLITPSFDYEAWLAALHYGALEAGLEMIVNHTGDLEPGSTEDRRLIVTTNKKFLNPAPDAHIAVIATGLVGAVAKTCELTGGSGIYAVIDAAELVVDALNYPNANIITEEATAAGRALEILPGLRVVAPTPSSGDMLGPVESAGAKALLLYANGLPDVGTSSEWLPQLFFYSPRREKQRERITSLDITGGPGLLVNGPQISLPPGRWEITVQFTLDDDAARYELALEWGGLPDHFVTMSVKPNHGGLFRAVMSFETDRSVRSELRIRLTEGALHGQFEFLGAQVRRTG